MRRIIHFLYLKSVLREQACNLDCDWWEKALWINSSVIYIKQYEQSLRESIFSRKVLWGQKVTVIRQKSAFCFLNLSFHFPSIASILPKAFYFLVKRGEQNNKKHVY